MADLTADTKQREPGCKCHWEEGDSPCPVHGEHEIHPTHVTPGGGDAPACPACGATTRPETSEPCRGHATPAPPLTEAELDDAVRELQARVHFYLKHGPTKRTALDQVALLGKVARRALALESELAQLRREKAERHEWLRALVAKNERRADLILEAWKAETDVDRCRMWDGRHAELTESTVELREALSKLENT